MVYQMVFLADSFSLGVGVDLAEFFKLCYVCWNMPYGMYTLNANSPIDIASTF